MNSEQASWAAVIVLGVLGGLAVRHLAEEIIAGFAVPIPRRVDQAEILYWDVIAEARRILAGEEILDGELVDEHQGDDGATG